jgi:hypothetical protein
MLLEKTYLSCIPIAACSMTDIGASGFPFPPVGFQGSTLVNFFHILTCTMIEKEIILVFTMDRVSPSCPVTGLILGTFIHYAVLLVTTAFTTPCVFINGNSDPRVLFRAGSVANCYTMGLSLALVKIGSRYVAVAISRYFLANTGRGSAFPLKRSPNRCCIVHFSQLTQETITASIREEVSVVIRNFSGSTCLIFYRIA